MIFTIRESGCFIEFKQNWTIKIIDKIRDYFGKIEIFWVLKDKAISFLLWLMFVIGDIHIYNNKNQYLPKFSSLNWTCSFFEYFSQNSIYE